MNDAEHVEQLRRSATIATGNANVHGQQGEQQHGAGRGRRQAPPVSVNVDQNSTNTNIGVAVANTGGNVGVGNASENNASANQTATATGNGSGDKIASNSANASNTSNGDVTDRHRQRVGARATPRTTARYKRIDAAGSTGLVLGDQNSNNLNFGLGIANSGLNVGVGNVSVNNSNAPQTATATGGGGGDKVAVNDATSSNSSDGSAAILTGNATASGNVASNPTTQVLNVASVRSSSSTLPLMLLLLVTGLLFYGRRPRARERASPGVATHDRNGRALRGPPFSF